MPVLQVNSVAFYGDLLSGKNKRSIFPLEQTSFEQVLCADSLC